MKINQKVAEWLGLVDDGSSRKLEVLSFAIVTLLGIMGVVTAGYRGFLAGLIAGSVFVALWRWRED